MSDDASSSSGRVSPSTPSEDLRLSSPDASLTSGALRPRRRRARPPRRRSTTSPPTLLGDIASTRSPVDPREDRPGAPRVPHHPRRRSSRAPWASSPTPTPTRVIHAGATSTTPSASRTRTGQPRRLRLSSRPPRASPRPRARARRRSRRRRANGAEQHFLRPVSPPSLLDRGASQLSPGTASSLSRRDAGVRIAHGER